MALIIAHVPHNDYDDYFGDAVFEAGGTTPTRQAYVYVKAQKEQPGWAEAVGA